MPDLYEPTICGLRCFENALADFNFVNYPCDSIFNPFISNSEDPADAGYIKIYPNPASAQVTLEYPSMNGEILQFELFDLTGKRVRWEQFDNNGNYTFDTSRLPSGIYVFRLLHNSQVLKNMKLSILE